MNRLLQRSYLIGPIIIFVVVLMIMHSMNQSTVDSLYDQERQIEDIIRQYAVYCYAQEGAYPMDLKYLQDNYGLIINENLYDYYYDAFASNIMPDIVVTAKETER